MMGNIQFIFEQRNKAGKKVNIAYITPEYPFEGITVPLAKMLSENNVHIIEIGVPFSDPLADGPTIQQSSYKALQENVNLIKIFSLVKSIRQDLNVGIILMSYINPILSFGIKPFIKEAVNAGVDGVIVPDLPVDEINFIKGDFDRNGLDLILLAALTSPVERLEIIASHSRGFIYCVSITGVTGVQKSDYIEDNTIKFLQRIRLVSSMPLAIGFGLSNRAQLEQLSEYTDGFIIGSALIKSMEQSDNKESALQSAQKFIQSVYKA